MVLYSVSMLNTNSNYYDFSVVGSGLSGLTVSLELARRANVLLITKTSLQDSATNLAQGGIASVLDEKDSFQNHIEDTLAAGSFHNNPEAVNYVVKNASKAIKWLTKQGVNFDKKNGHLDQRLESGHKRARIIHAKDQTGKFIVEKLVEKVKQNRSITTLENTFCIDLIVKKKLAVGMVCLMPDGTIKKIITEAVILATGGLGQIYKWTTNPLISTADGFALAKRAGVQLADMEFIQFHPTALSSGKSPLFLLSETLRGAGAYIVNNRGERFVDEHLPRDIVSQEIFKMQSSGKNCFLDLRHLENIFLLKNFPNIYKTLRKFGFDPSADLIPITPAAHYSCGGVKVNLKGETSVKNLYAVGEVARTGLHGANRLASNSLLEAVVFALSIARSIKKQRKSFFKNWDFMNQSVQLKKSNLKLKKRLTKIESDLKNIMWEKAGILRTNMLLTEAKKEISKMRREFNIYKFESLSVNGDLKQLRKYLEVCNMIEVAFEIVSAAARRRKSLGCHFII